ncbi:MAG: hypothetical protein KAJ51_08130, partial [Thermoplasmata archaeon]|nr:hypothetical protein [Thermoplasmata archaeon]
VHYYNVTAENEFGEGPSSDEINITPVFKPKKNDQNILNTLNPLRCAMGIILIILAIVFLINMILARRRLKKSRELEKTEIKIDTDKKDRMDK